MNKIKILTWLVAVLLILNISTIATVLFQKKSTASDEQAIVIDAENNKRITGRFFRQELNFNNEQMEVFRNANQLFQHKVRSIVIQLDSLKTENFIELNSINSDSMKLNELALKIGLQHKELKLVTNEFYLKLKIASNEQQLLLLQKAFSPLFSTDSFNTRPMNGGRNRRNSNNKLQNN